MHSETTENAYITIHIPKYTTFLKLGFFRSFSSYHNGSGVNTSIIYKEESIIPVPMKYDCIADYAQML